MTADIALKSGRYHAWITSLGGGIRGLTWGGKNLTDTYPVGTPIPAACGIMLGPWPNRTADGIFSHRGHIYRLPITEPERNNAIHGFIGDVEWEVKAATPDSAHLQHLLEPRPGWPWRMRFDNYYTLSDEGLECRSVVTNMSSHRIPFGFGVHTYINAQDALLDECVLDVPAAARLPLDPDRNLPCGPLTLVGGTQFDLQDRQLAGTWLDDAFTVHPARKTVCKVVNSAGVGSQIWWDGSFGWVQVYTAPNFPRRGRAIAIEPMTCPPNALRTGVDLIYLQPGEHWEASWGVAGVGGEGKK